MGIGLKNEQGWIPAHLLLYTFLALSLVHLQDYY
jgi:hypothetical protein